MSVSQLAKSIAESPTLRLNEQARLLREKGEAVIHLGVGEPKNRAPIAAILAAASKLNGGDVKYTPADGTPGLKKQVIRYTEENYDRVVAPENVIISAGAKQSVFNILYSVLNPQEEVVILAPYWVSYPEMVRMCYGVPVIVKAEDGGFVPRMEDIEKAVGSQTRVIICNSPNNPSGVLYPESLIAQLVDFCERKGIWLVMDDIYHKLVFDGKKSPSCFRYTNKDTETSKVIAVNGVSKLYGMTGFRIGWAVAARELVAVLTNIQSQTTTCSSTVLQAGAEAALNGDPAEVEALRRQMQEHRDLVLAGLAAIPGVRCAKPDGTFYCLPDVRAIDGDSMRLCQRLLREALVVTVPGREFGMEGHLRISYAGAREGLVEALARLRWALDPSSPATIEIGGRTHTRDWA